MKLTIIEDLKKAKPKRRGKIILEMRAKNIAYFKRRNQPLGEAIERLGSGDFEIRINDVFLDVIERNTGSYCHAPGRLLEYLETVASWHHTGWIDKLEVVHRYSGPHEHGELIHAFLEGLYRDLPQVSERMRAGVIQLPKLGNGRRFSGATVFLGALTGLHIVRYLNTTVLRDIMILEPDVKKFALSCCFVDYEAIERQFGRLVLHVGEDMPENPLDFLLNTSPVTASVWLRLLPIYPSAAFESVINRINLRWRTQHEVIVPFDREMRNLTYGAANIRAGRPILCKQPTLSPRSRIAVVGSGPSLDQDLDWLRANQHKLIIICAHSTVRVLKRHGIKPDFQCTLDTELDEEILAKLQLDPAVPFVVYYKADPALLAKFETVLLVTEIGKANAVRFRQPLSCTHPTSGNTSVAVAAFMRPAEIYLLGLDLGFRSTDKNHAAGTWHGDEGGAGRQDAESRDAVLATANFSESRDTIYTHAYYNLSRFGVEQALATYAPDVRVLNLSDGVRIKGAEPRRSGDVALDEYAEKQQDLAAIRAAFVANAEGVWEPYPTHGAEMLQCMKEDLLAAIRLKSPDWLGFATALDCAWSKAVTERLRNDPTDIRIEAYSKLIQDLLANWYRMMAFTRTPSEFETGYAAGIRQLEALFSRLEWPNALDFDVRSESLSNVG